MIELKCGNDSFGSYPKKMSEMIENHRKEIRELEYDGTLGSGILGHIYDMSRCLKKGYYQKYIKKDLSRILASYHALGLVAEVADFSLEQLPDILERYFIILDNQKDVVLHSMERYLYDSPGASKYNVEFILGTEVLKGFIFLFTSDEGRGIHSILDDRLYKAYQHHPAKNRLEKI